MPGALMPGTALARPGLWRFAGWALIVLVIYLSLTPEPPTTTVRFGDKLGHVAAYASLMGWWLQIDRRPERLALLFVLMGLALEILQSLGGHRTGDILDMAANTLGVGLGWLSALLLPDWLARLDRGLARSPGRSPGQ
jgi:VanZ family protein